jgi:hypothetical protein
MSFPSETGRLPTLEALERELVARADSRIPPRYPRATVVAAALAIIVAMTALTPFGRAVAEEIADWIGIGDAPTREQVDPVGEPAVVIGYGVVDGVRFELIASADPAFARGTGDPVPCFDVDFPELSNFAALCLTPETRATLSSERVTATALLDPAGPVPGHPLMVAGLADGAVAEVHIEDGSGAEAVAANVGRLTPDLAARIGLDKPYSFYLAFLPADAADPIRVRALDEDARLVGESSSPINRAPSPASD